MNIFENLTIETKTIKLSTKDKVTVRLGMTASEFREAVDETSLSVFDDNNVYVSSFREFLRRYIMLKYFTDIEVTDKDIANIFVASQNGTWFSEIENVVTSLPIWAELEKAVDNQIEYLIVTRKTSFDNICDKIIEIISDIWFNLPSFAQCF